MSRGWLVAAALTGWVACGGAPAASPELASTATAEPATAEPASGPAADAAVAAAIAGGHEHGTQHRYQRAGDAPDADPAPAAEHGGERAHGGEHGHGGEAGGGHAHGARSIEPLGHTFEDAERWAAQFDRPGRKRWQQPARVIERMQIAPGMAVADIGAGTGYFMPYLAAAVGAEGRVLALDIEPDMVRYLAMRAERDGLSQVQSRQVAVDDPGLAPGSVDRVLIVNTWHHIPEREVYAAKLASGLAPGGAVVVVDYRLDAERGPPKRHRLPPATVAAELASAGLVTQILPRPLPHQYIVIARRPR